jgi:hypothetical protein
VRGRLAGIAPALQLSKRRRQRPDGLQEADFAGVFVASGSESRLGWAVSIRVSVNRLCVVARPLVWTDRLFWEDTPFKLLVSARHWPELGAFRPLAPVPRAPLNSIVKGSAHRRGEELVLVEPEVGHWQCAPVTV